MNKADKPMANPIIVLREELDNWAVLFNPDTAEAVGTNPVGVAVWKRMDGQKSLQEIVSEIHKGFENTPTACSHEVIAFVDRLIENGFAQLGEESK